MFTKTHHHFMLTSNPWPLISSFCAFNLLFSILLFFKFSSLLCFFASVVSLSCLSFLWWVAYSGEFVMEGKESSNLEEGVKFSMVLFISSEIFFFFSFFWSYFHFFLSPMMEISLQWPPLCVEMFEYSEVPLINTLTLMLSGVTVTLSHHFLSSGKTKPCMYFLFTTIMLGSIFSLLQWMEYTSSFFTISDSTFGTSFFMLTGFHGLHVIIGSLFLLTVYVRFFLVSSSKCDSSSFELASWYWHFVDVVWLFLYFSLYYVNG